MIGNFLKPKIKPLERFKSKSGKEIEIWEPTMNRLPQVLEFVNRLAKEDSFLSFNPCKTLSTKEEGVWLTNQIQGMKRHQLYLVWAIYQDKIVGSCDLVRGITYRDSHVGKIELMIDYDFRRDGIGLTLLEYILQKAREMNFKIVSLTVFGDNKPAISLYKKMGFKEWGRLPKGFFRQGKYSDSVKMYKKLEGF